MVQPNCVLGLPFLYQAYRVIHLQRPGWLPIMATYLGHLWSNSRVVCSPGIAGWELSPLALSGQEALNKYLVK